MKSSKTISAFTVFILAAAFAMAQTNDHNPEDSYRATHWGLDEGLSQGETYNILKDVYGFMWIATRNGLNRFDGSKIKIYYHDPKDSRSIGYDGTNGGMVEDSAHNLWIATNNDFLSFGLSRYDIKADTFTNFLPRAPGSIEPFWTNKDEVWCVENDSLISSYNVHSYQRKVLINLAPYNGLSAGRSVNNKIVDRKSNSIWSLCGMPGNKDNTRFGLLQISLTTGEKKFYDWPCYKKILGHDHVSERFKYDEKRNCIWISSNDGLIQFSIGDKQFHYTEALNSLPDMKDFLKEHAQGHWVGIDLDNEGRVWIATVQKGIVIYNPDNRTVSLPFANDPALQKEISDYNEAIYCDRDGIVWTGSWKRKGVYQVDPYSAVVKRYDAGNPGPGFLSNKNVNSAVSAGDGKVWLGSANGLNIFDPLTNSFRVLYKEDFPGLGGNNITPRVINRNINKAWIDVQTDQPGRGDKFTYEMDLTTGICREIIFRDSSGHLLVSTHAKFIVPYKNGCLVALSSGWEQTIVYELSGSNTEPKRLLNLPPGKFYLFPTLAENEQRLFFRAYDQKQNLSFKLVNNQWIPGPTLLDSIDWERMFYNLKDASYWIAADHHLLHYDQNFRLIKRYTKEDGMPTFSIQRIICDNNNNLWFNTDRSIHQLNLKTGTIIKLSEKDGFKPQDFSFSEVGKDDYGNIYFPAGFFGAGFDKVNPKNLKSAPASVYLERLEINQHPFLSSNAANSLQQLSLRYFENKITIETGVIDFYSKGKSNIRYKLEGGSIKNAAWQYAPAFNTIRFEELPPGEYNLSIQAGNAGNEFIGPLKRLLIIVSHPFWQTWWFKVLSVILVISLIFGFIQYRSRNLNKRNIVLEKKVTERTNELNNSLAELKTTQDQLIQSEKMASLGELTSGIAHEIKNPLNFVNNFSEINTELITEIEEELIPNLDENNQAQMAPFIKTLKKNLEKINHHGKRIDGIVKGMLQHSRLGNVTKEPVDINALCDESLKLAWHSFKAKEKTFNASFETRFDPDLPELRVFPQDFGRVMINLINNAFYAVHEKKKRNQSDLSDALQTESLYKPSVIVSTQKNGNKIFITVSDNGMGIPSTIVNKIFQPFFTTKPTGEGTGLGLSMAYDIISKSHGGEIKAKSKEGFGTDFEIMLPI